MKTQTFFLAVALAMAGSTPATHAQTSFLPQSETDAIVLQFQVTYADTFDRRDAKGMAALFNENATLQNEWGDVVKGRNNIEATLIRLMANLPTGARLEDTPLVSHAVAPDVIVSQGTSQRISPNNAPIQMFFTRVLVHEGNQWRLAATQIARPSAMPKPASHPK
ncbi:MAG: SgcJ/EcaC family oxidoreductase [Candidatus Udaeobacter sp.]